MNPHSLLLLATVVLAGVFVDRRQEGECQSALVAAQALISDIPALPTNTAFDEFIAKQTDIQTQTDGCTIPTVTGEPELVSEYYAWVSSLTSWLSTNGRQVQSIFSVCSTDPIFSQVVQGLNLPLVTDTLCSSYVFATSPSTTTLTSTSDDSNDSTSTSSSRSSTTPSTPDSRASNPAASTPTPVSSGSTNIGAIVGGVIGGVALLALIGFGIYFVRQHNAARGTTPAPEAQKDAGGPSVHPDHGDTQPGRVSELQASVPEKKSNLPETIHEAGPPMTANHRHGLPELQ